MAISVGYKRKGFCLLTMERFPYATSCFWSTLLVLNHRSLPWSLALIVIYLRTQDLYIIVLYNIQPLIILYCLWLLIIILWYLTLPRYTTLRLNNQPYEPRTYAYTYIFFFFYNGFLYGNSSPRSAVSTRPTANDPNRRTAPALNRSSPYGTTVSPGSSFSPSCWS